MKPSIDPLRIKVKRAKEHIRNLELEIKTFFDTDPYKVITKRNPQTRQLIYYLGSVQDVPENISAVTGDVLQNLRGSLDHLAYALFMVGPGGLSGASARHIYFPIMESAAKYMSESKRKVQGMRKDAIDAIDKVKPYKGGNDLLWKLNELNNISKHRFVIMAGSEFRSLDIGGYMLRKMLRDNPDFAPLGTLDVHAFFKPSDTGFPLQKGYELFIDAPDAEVDQKLQFRFQIALREPGIIEGEPLLETLQSVADLVDNLLTDFEPLLV